ncbi:MAG: sulfatase [Planctomycetota bacterium]|nr:sulfatase [Planctomycetota bacterium]
MQIAPILAVFRGTVLTASLCLLTNLPTIAIAETAAPKGNATKKKNVLLIAIDDLNNWIGCLGGHPQALTPNIDKLAKRGVLFSNAHCQGPICGPSRCSLLSGKFPHSTGVYQQPGGDLLEKDHVHFRGQLLPEYFAKHNYETLASGKITHGYAGKIAFKDYAGKQGGFGPKPKERFQYFLPNVPFTGTQTDWGAFPEQDSQMPDFKTASWCIDKLNEPRTKPFFLAAGFYRPHVPFYVPAKWFQEFPLQTIHLPEYRLDDLDDVPQIGIDIHEMPKYPKWEFLVPNEEEQFRRAVQAYLACIRFVDHQVGRVVEALEASPYRDDTVIVLFSDHGYHLGEKNRISKHSLWEESTKVPLIIVDGQHRGRQSAAPVGLIDIYPTLLELCDLPARPENEGMSLLPLMKNTDAKLRDGILTTYARGNHSVRSERFRLIRYQDGSQELYDHKTDPQEWNNLASKIATTPELQTVVKKLAQLLPKEESEYHPSTQSGPVNAWFQEHLLKNGIE